MSQTPLSSTSTYCTAAQLVRYCDWRTLADHLSDDGVRLPTSAAVQSSTVLAKILMAASGEVETAALVGGRYSPDDLRAIADAATPTNATERLAEIVAGLALWRVLRRRPDPNRPVPEMTRESQAWLEKLARGDVIFPTQEAADAGVVDSVVESARSHIDPRQQVTVQAGRFFGRRADRSDPARQ